MGFQRSRWSTELFAQVLRDYAGIKVHSSTLRRWLPQLGNVWRRAAPTLRIRDPHKYEKLAAIRAALERCSAEHQVFYEGEVDIHLNPKIGTDWGFRCKPGQNEKHYLAGSLHAGTGKVSYVGSGSICSELFISMLKQLRRTYRHAKTITLIVDNYIIHKSKKTRAWLKKNPKFILLFQPVYSPWVNKIEKLWNALHEAVTRNHKCKNMWPPWFGEAVAELGSVIWGLLIFTVHNSIFIDWQPHHHKTQGNCALIISGQLIVSCCYCSVLLYPGKGILN